MTLATVSGERLLVVDDEPDIAALAGVGERAVEGDAPTDSELLELVTRAYGLRPASVSALLDWDIR